ncbi:acetyltransferase [Syntrophotalea acetylenivorans]|uniref:Acetyltransferase n=1 Tax=Syntrophotalea acetylenivorans TaxID=1842532 RepID=A0A1L3GKG5_9BACT|nr:acyltransferase [Syntrophotalea acetylenivorans]APG26443.1 acetyltransferase [Syntrophotalea acetylenivorans]
MFLYLAKCLLRTYRNNQLLKLSQKFHREATIGPFFELELGASIKNESDDKGKIIIGHHCRINGTLACKEFGKIKIGNYSTIQSGASIECLQNISIGNFSAVAGCALVTDNNTHAIGIEEWIKHRIRTAPEGAGYPGLGNGWELSDSAPVKIGDGVWVGAGSTILKGVTVGDGAIVARGSVVTKDVVPFTIVAGNPARKVKDLPVPDKPIDEIVNEILVK